MISDKNKKSFQIPLDIVYKQKFLIMFEVLNCV